MLFIKRVGFFCKQGLVLVLFIKRVGFFLLARPSVSVIHQEGRVLSASKAGVGLFVSKVWCYLSRGSGFLLARFDGGNTGPGRYGSW